MPYPKVGPGCFKLCAWHQVRLGGLAGSLRGMGRLPYHPARKHYPRNLRISKELLDEFERWTEGYRRRLFLAAYKAWEGENALRRTHGLKPLRSLHARHFRQPMEG